jgi:hypothetical protein
VARPFEGSTPPPVIGEAKKRISLVIEGPEVEEFCIGITDDPVNVKGKEACDEVVILHHAKNPSEARAMANELAKDFGTLEKCSNKEGRAEEASSGGSTTYVCLAVWYRERRSW